MITRVILYSKVVHNCVVSMKTSSIVTYIYEILTFYKQKYLDSSILF